MNRPRTKKSMKPTVKSKSVSGNSLSHRRTRAPGITENPKLAALKRAHFTKKGKSARIARAEQALLEIDKIGSTFKLDNETVRSIAEDPDLEYL